MKNTLNILLVIILLGCTPSIEGQSDQVSTNTEEVLEKLSTKKNVHDSTLEVIKEKENYEAQKEEPDNQEVIQFDKNLLVGIWAVDEDSDADFFIEGDSIFFVRHPDQGYFYEVKKDKLTFYFDGFETTDKILKLTKDSLHIVNDVSGETTKLYNRNTIY